MRRQEENRKEDMQRYDKIQRVNRRREEERRKEERKQEAKIRQEKMRRQEEIRKEEMRREKEIQRINREQEEERRIEVKKREEKRRQDEMRRQEEIRKEDMQRYVEIQRVNRRRETDRIKEERKQETMRQEEKIGQEKKTRQDEMKGQQINKHQEEERRLRDDTESRRIEETKREERAEQERRRREEEKRLFEQKAKREEEQRRRLEENKRRQEQNRRDNERKLQTEEIRNQNKQIRLKENMMQKQMFLQQEICKNRQHVERRKRAIYLKELDKKHRNERNVICEQNRIRQDEKRKQRMKLFTQEEEKKNNEKAKQFLHSEERLSNWERREQGTIHEHSQNLEGSSPKSIFSNFKMRSFSKYISNYKKETQIYDEQQKDDRCVLQEMIDIGYMNEATSVTISNVLLTVQKKIQSYQNHNIYHRMRQSPDHHLVRRFCFQRSNLTDNEKEFPDCIFEICLAVKLTKNYWPRNTQITSLYLLIKSIQKGTLLEINTGEGKTCIIAMFSAFLALCHIVVDIVSSSPILAQRDYTEWNEFYKLLNISVSCNLIPKKTAERLKCYSNRVVYGTVASFASDLLRQTFLMENVRGERKCEAVIVDEADCMLLDQGVHFTYLSHAVPGMHHIEPILFMIWKHIIKHERIVSEKSEHFFLGILDSLPVVLSLYNGLSEFSMEADIPSEIIWLYILGEKKLFNASVLKGNISEFENIFTVEKILECLKFVEEDLNFPIRFQPYTILNETTVRAVQWEHSAKAAKRQIIHLLVVGKGLVCVLHAYEDEKEIHIFIKDEIKEYISFDGRKENKHHIPAYLEEFVDNRLITWIANAFTAKYMLNGREYLVKDKDVVPVDFESTGVVQLDTKWGDCLHQFLEIKHGKKLSQITLETNFMSNQEYFCRYEGKIFGVSGTLGTEREKSFLMKQFNLCSQKIPTYRSKVFEELPGIICNSKLEWITAIKDIVRDQVAKQTNQMKRAVLVICEDINTAKELQNILIETVCAYAALYTRNDENNDKIDSILKAGDVIVATNIVGRGTDIEIDETVEKAGGLFVLVTFLPQSSRTENQVFGRSARKGQPGSGQIVLNKYSLPLHFSLHKLTCMESLKHLRDAIEEKRIADIEKYAFEEARLKEKLFARYCSFLCEIKDQLNFKGVEENIMMHSLHEYWGMWLKTNFETKENSSRTENLENSLNDTLIIAKNKLSLRISPCSNASFIIKLANEQLFDRNYALSIDLFTQAIRQDRKWAAISFYNRAYCSLLKKEPGYITKAINDLTKSQECFALFKKEAVLCLALSSSMKDEYNNTEEANGTASQFNSRCQIINYFEENIMLSLQQLRKFQKANKEVRAEGTSIFTIVLGDEDTNKRIESEIYMYWEMGLTQLIFVKERKPFCWKGMLVVALGVLQIAVGTVLIAFTAGILTQLGWGLIAEGVNDICTGAYAVWKNDQEFMKSWMVGKAVSIAVSVASFGYSQAKTAAKGVKGAKASVAAVKQHFKTSAKNVISELKSMGSMITSKSYGPVFQSTCVEVGTEVGLRLAKRGEQFLLEVFQEKVKWHFADIARESIKTEIQFAFTDGEMHPVVDNFINFHCSVSIQINQIAAKYMDITKKLLCSKNINQLRQVLLGCVKDVIKTTSKQLQTKQTDIFEQCKPIFDIINEIECASYDMKQLVTVYCNHVKTALKDIYADSLTNEAFSYIMEGHNKDMCTIKQQIIDQTANFLLSLLTESFEFTGSGILAEKLQNAVGKCINEYGGKNVGTGTIGKIIAISSTTGKIGKDLITTGKIDVKTVVESGLDATETVLDLVTDENTKRIIEFGLNTAKTSIHALQSSKTCDAIDAVTDIAADGISKFVDPGLKHNANFALNAAKNGLTAYKSGKTEDIFDAATYIAADAIDKFVDGDMKDTANFALNATTKGVKALQSGESEKIFDAVAVIAADGIKTFVDDDMTDRANFALNVTTKGIKALQSGESEKMLDAVADIAADCIETFADDDMTDRANFALNVTTKGVKALQSGKSENIFDAVAVIAADGINKFVDDDMTDRANFVLNVTTKGIKALQTGESEKMLDAVADIAADCIEKFADDDMKCKVNFVLNATNKGESAYKSGKAEDILKPQQTSLLMASTNLSTTT